jgi:acylphosphatase
MAKARLHAVVHGYVQGVFFRDNAQRTAGSMGLTGWVKNTVDGDVEIVAEGEEKDLKKLLAWCHKGPDIARVEKVDSKWEKPTGEFEHFSIKY